MIAQTASVRDFGAKGDNAADDTAAVQACIDNSAANRAACYLPPGVYKITGPGLSMRRGQPSLYGLQSQGSGSPTLVYYGSGTALTVGNCADTSTFTYSVSIVNVTITAANGTTPQYGVQLCGVSQGDFKGMIVGGNSTSGYFTNAALRVFDSSELDFDNLELSQLAYHAGTTGLLFDDKSHWGNAMVTVRGAEAAIFAFHYGIVCKSCIDITFKDGLAEGNDFGLFVDNSTWTSAGDGIFNMTFDSGWNFLEASIAGPTHNKVLEIDSVTGARLAVQNLVFRSNKWQLAGGVTYPVVLNIPSTGTGSVLTLKLDTNNINGARMAVIDSDNALANVWFTGENEIFDASGTGTRPADVHGTATTTDYAPTNTSQQKLAWLDPSGQQYAAGSSSAGMARPANTYKGPGVIQGVNPDYPLSGDDGFLRVEAGGNTTPFYKAFCDFSGYSLVTEMNRSIVCFIGGSEVTRTDGRGFTIGGGTAIRKYSTISARLDFSAPASVPGCTLRLRLTGAGTVVNSAPIFYSPPVTVPAGMTFSAWTEPDGIIAAQWCQFSGAPIDPDGAGAIYTFSVLQ